VRRFDLRVGSILGIRLSLHVSWFLVFALVVWVTMAGFAEIYPEIRGPVRFAMGLVTGAAFFVCLTVHELAHALTARRFGIRVRGITLFLFGGVAEIEGEVPTPAREFAVALVGPAVSTFLGAVFALGTQIASSAGRPVAEGILGTLALVNLGVALFNLFPGLPLDGGRLVRAALWRLSGSYAAATRVAAAGGSLLAVLLVALGVLLVVAEGETAGLWYVPMGLFLWFLARAAGRRRRPPSVPGGLALDDREGQAPQPRP
jgi:Zn-dependent protease